MITLRAHSIEEASNKMLPLDTHICTRLEESKLLPLGPAHILLAQVLVPLHLLIKFISNLILTPISIERARVLNPRVMLFHREGNEVKVDRQS